MPKIPVINVMGRKTVVTIDSLKKAMVDLFRYPRR